MRRFCALLVAGICAATIVAAGAAPAKRYDLQDLNGEQQAELWRLLDVHAAAVAMLNYCQRPPLLEQRLGEIAAECVTEHSWSLVETRFQDRLQSYRVRWNCADPGTRSRIVTWERRIDALVRAARRVCR